ncbi:hypothetical protein ROHU_024089 [Labeo rohita]|uniref:Uncharacterized protein n=1 Tax=Labeo rohita TaxID=84645 RepID=A0A498MML3_LABRO|nr:hypothetical protein ROHU_024089 [Labeo rohita]
MNLLVKSAEKLRWGAVLASGIQQGHIQDQFRFRIKDNIIPKIQERPVKSLGKWYRADLNDKQSVREMIIQADTWMTSLEKSGLPGRYRAWGYQHGVFPRLLWPLLVYEVPVSTVEGLERKINTYLRRWLVVPRSFCSIGLYSTGSKLQLPVTSVLEEYKATKTRQAMMLQDSKDERVRQAGIVVRTGHKWSASTALTETEDRLQHAGLDWVASPERAGAKPTQRNAVWYRWEVRKAEEETRYIKAVAMKNRAAGQDGRAYKKGPRHGRIFEPWKDVE